MFSSAELIEALLRRRRRSIRPLPPPGFPAGWRDWFTAMVARPGRVSGAAAPDIVAAAAARMPRLPTGIAAELGRWRAFALLWRQGPLPASRDERWARIASMSGTVLLHVLFVVALVWLMLHRFHFPAPADDARAGEELVLQVEYIGEGSPLDAGGGAPAVPAEAVPTDIAPRVAVEPPRAPAQPATIPGQAAPQPPDASTPPDPADAPPEPDLVLAPRDVVLEAPELTPAEVPLPDVLQVTEVEVADSRFAVPPPREVDVSVPADTAAAVAARERAVELRAPEAEVLPSRTVPMPSIEAPRVPTPGVAARAREIEVTDPGEVALRSRTGLPAIDAVGPRPADAPALPARAVPMPSERSASGRQGGPSAAPAPESGARSAGNPGSNESRDGTGPGLLPALPGGAPSGRVSDDWGDSTRDVAGRQAGTPGASGLFNADGSPRLAGGGDVGGGLPPGTITEEFENIDRHGTWLKRPPYDYEPTAFDRFWMPSETLLEEWVRRSVTEVRIPIPGTTKSIRCVTVMLALGGACGIVDPNLEDQPAEARPPPDVPFKPDLQEARDSLGEPSGS